MTKSPKELWHKLCELESSLQESVGYWESIDDMMRLLHHQAQQIEALTAALKAHQRAYFGRDGGAQHLSNEEYESSHTKAYLDAADVLKKIEADTWSDENE